MTDLDERISSGLQVLAERIEPESDGDEVADRLRSRSNSTFGRPRRRSLAVLGAAAAAVIVLSLVIRVTRDDEDKIYVGTPDSTAAVVPSTTAAPATTIPETVLQGWWDPLPAGPMDGMAWRAAVWTGTELIVWRGEDPSPPWDTPTDRAARYHPPSRTWALIGPDPLAEAGVHDTTGFGVGGVWTGHEAVFWAKEGMVVFQPETTQWSSPTSPPRPHEHSAVWTGQEVLFVLDGLAYNPAADTWRELAMPPAEFVSSINDDAHGLALTGSSVVAVGSGAAIYDIATDSWRPVDAPSAAAGTGWDGATATAFVLGGRLFALTGTSATMVELNQASGTWTRRPDLDGLVATSEGAPVALTLANGRVLLWHIDRGVLLQPDDAIVRLPTLANVTIQPVAITASWGGDRYLASVVGQVSGPGSPTAMSLGLG